MNVFFVRAANIDFTFFCIVCPTGLMAIFRNRQQQKKRNCLWDDSNAVIVDHASLLLEIGLVPETKSSYDCSSGTTMNIFIKFARDRTNFLTYFSPKIVSVFQISQNVVVVPITRRYAMPQDIAGSRIGLRSIPAASDADDSIGSAKLSSTWRLPRFGHQCIEWGQPTTIGSIQRARFYRWALPGSGRFYGPRIDRRNDRCQHARIFA